MSFHSMTLMKKFGTLQCIEHPNKHIVNVHSWGRGRGVIVTSFLTCASCFTSFTSLPSSAMSLSRCVQNLSILASRSASALSIAFLTLVILGPNVCKNTYQIIISKIIKVYRAQRKVRISACSAYHKEW